MLRRGGPFRLLVSLLLVVGVPFCCCNFHAWLSSCSTCDEHSEPRAIAHEHSHASTHEHDVDRATDSSAEDDDTPRDESGPCGPHHEGEHDCSCGGHDSQMLTGAKLSLRLPDPVMVAVLDWVLDGTCVQQTRNVQFESDGWTGLRPPTSLLLLHCALVV